MLLFVPRVSEAILLVLFQPHYRMVEPRGLVQHVIHSQQVFSDKVWVHKLSLDLDFPSLKLVCPSRSLVDHNPSSIFDGARKCTAAS